MANNQLTSCIGLVATAIPQQHNFDSAVFIPPYGSMGYLVYCVFVFCLFCLFVIVCTVRPTNFSAAEKDSGVKLCTLVRLLSGMSSFHFGELWLAGSHGGALLPVCTGATRRLPARLGEQSELSAVARCGSRNWGRRRRVRPYDGICILQVCCRTCFLS